MVYCRLYFSFAIIHPYKERTNNILGVYTHAKMIFLLLLLTEAPLIDFNVA